MILHLFNREFKLLRRLKSKKNRVYLVESKEGHFVLKLYRRRITGAPSWNTGCCRRPVGKD